MDKGFFVVKPVSRVLLALCCLLPCLSSASALEPGLEHFLGWFEGEYDNNEQVWQQAEDGIPESERHERIHHIFRRVAVPALGEHVYFVRQYQNGDYEDVYRQRLYRFDTETDGRIRLAIFRFKEELPYRNTDREPALVAELAPDDLVNHPGCDVYWVFEDDRYEGEMPDGACTFFSERMQKTIIIDDSLMLNANALHISDQAVDEDGNPVFGRSEPHINRKVRYFKGWALIDHEHLERLGRTTPLEPDERNVNFFADLRVHNEGQILPLVTADGQDSGYAIELARLTYQNTRVAILKLGLIDVATGKTITYAWADPGATRIGINLRWLQVGLTAEDIHDRS